MCYCIIFAYNELEYHKENPRHSLSGILGVLLTNRQLAELCVLELILRRPKCSNCCLL